MTNRALGLALVLTSCFFAPARAQLTTLPLWPHGTPEPAQVGAPEIDAGNPAIPNTLDSVRNVTQPTLAVYAPGHPNGVGVVVLPGGGYDHLAYAKEGTQACRWLNSIDITCLLVKYRVPETVHYPANPAPLEDAQQAVRLTRAHAADWHLDPARIGVLGFSAGAHLAILLCTHPDDNHVLSTPAADDVPRHEGAPLDARVNFALLVYPAYVALPSGFDIDPALTPNSFTPPTFLLQAEDDQNYGRNAMVFYRALFEAHIPAELHYYATGGHGFGMHPVDKPEEHWTQLATAWLRASSLLPPAPRGNPHGNSSGNDPGTAGGFLPPAPCPANLPTAAGTPRPKPSDDPSCW